MTDFPERIICLTEESTELLYLLGEQDRIAGVTVYTVRPEQARKEKPKVSSFISGNIKKIKALKPDLIIGFSDIQADLARDLIKEGLNVWISNQRTIAEIFDQMLALGSLVGKRQETQSLILDWKDKLAYYKNQTVKRYKTEDRPGVFFQEWDDPIITGITWVSELIELIGGRDCFSHLKDCSLARDRIISEADVEIANPDVIIGSWCGKPMDFQKIYETEKWENISAIRNRKVFEIDASIILQPGPALFIDGIDRLASILDS